MTAKVPPLAQVSWKTYYNTQHDPKAPWWRLTLKSLRREAALERKLDAACRKLEKQS